MTFGSHRSLRQNSYLSLLSLATTTFLYLFLCNFFIICISFRKHKYPHQGGFIEFSFYYYILSCPIFASLFCTLHEHSIITDQKIPHISHFQLIGGTLFSNLTKLRLRLSLILIHLRQFRSLVCCDAGIYDLLDISVHDLIQFI